MTSRATVAALGVSRLGFAVLLGRDPARVPTGMGASERFLPAATWLVRAATAREVVVAVGTLRSAGTGRGQAGWLAAMAAGDGLDAVAYTAGALTGDLGRRPALGAAAFAASGLVFEGWLARRLARESR